MKRKRYIKQLMALGVSRNTATATADATSRAKVPLIKTLGRIQAMQYIYVGEMVVVKQWRKAFDQILHRQAVGALRILGKTPRPHIRPLAKKKRGLNGLRADFAAVDELSNYGGARHE